MFTFRTRFALALLHDISQGDYRVSEAFHYPASESFYLLLQLENKHFISLTPNAPVGVASSYRLCCKYSEISLLDILEAIGEGVYFNSPNKEEFYCQYGITARKLGIVNQMTRFYLSEIHVVEIPVESVI